MSVLDNNEEVVRYKTQKHDSLLNFVLIFETLHSEISKSFSLYLL